MRKLFTLENAILAFVIVLLAIPLTRARAETVLHEQIVGSGGLVCDNSQEVADFIGLREQGELLPVALEAIPGCGILVIPMRMRVVNLGAYETATHRYVLVRYEFLDAPFPPQYGIDSEEPLQRS